MKGTPKQIEWAKEIQKKFLKELSTSRLNFDVPARTFSKEIKKEIRNADAETLASRMKKRITAANIYIDYRDSSLYHFVEDHPIDFFPLMKATVKMKKGLKKLKVN